MPKPVKSIESMEKWIRKQVAPSLAAVVTARGGDLGVVEDLLHHGKRRMKSSHRIAIEAAKRNRL